MGDFGLINWRSRGYLPHFDAPGSCQHIVFGLADSVSDDLGEDAPATDRYLAVLDAELDAGRGQCLLRDPLCAQIVQDELLHHDVTRYRLLAWCIMPNHVHVVVEQGEDLAGTVRRWKSWTTRAINAAVGRHGPLWRREYFDRFARSERHLAIMIAYVEANPVAAGLVGDEAEWAWSSASRRGNVLAGRAPGGPEG